MRGLRKTDIEYTSTGSALVRLTLVVLWIMGFIVAKGFWSTLFCIIPFWSWYLSIEHIMTSAGIL